MRSAPAVKLDDRVLLKALIHRTPVPIHTVDSLPNNMGAMYDYSQQVIFVCRGMGAEDIFRSVSKELAHAELAGTRQDYNRSDAAFAAYSASYLLCKRYRQLEDENLGKVVDAESLLWNSRMPINRGNISPSGSPSSMTPSIRF